MQNSKVCIRQTGENQVGIDVAGAALKLTYHSDPLAREYLGTMETLGFEPVEPSPSADLTFSGSVEDIQKTAASLEEQVEAMAGYGAVSDGGFQPYHSGTLDQSLNLGALRNIRRLPNGASLMVLAGAVTAPLADTATDDTLYMYYDRTPYWRGDRTGVLDEHGKPLRAFLAKDIGGLLIGPDGLKARSSFSFALGLDNQTLNRLHLLSTVKGVTMGEENRQAFHNFLADPDRPAVEPQPEPKKPRNLQVSYPRTDLEAIYSIESHPNAKLSDTMRLALGMHLAKSIEDPDIAARIRSEHDKIRARYDV